jgi:hypothetical protein
MHDLDQTPLDTIAGLIGHCQPQVERIVDAVIARSALVQEVAALRETTEAIAERLSALAADEADCVAMLARLDGDSFDQLPEFDGLDADETQDMRQSLRSRLAAHRGVLQNHQATLARGIEIGRTGMVSRFAIFAVAGLAEDGAPSMPSGLAFIVACQVAAQLKDRIETAGYRWAGEKTLVTLYLNAFGCERRKSPERQVADPVASIIATRLGFRSARELHQALHALHEAVATAQDEMNAATGAGLGHVQFDRRPCAAFDASYAASTALDDAFLQLMQRVRSGPAT